MTLRKLLSEGLLVQTTEGYKLADRYYEIAKNTSVDKNDRKDDTVNVTVNDTARLKQLTERQRKIYEIVKSGTIDDTVNDMVNDTVNAKNLSALLGKSVITIKRDLYVLRDLNLIQFVGSDKTGHWEVK